MPLIDHLLASASVRQMIWRLWYPFLTRRLRQRDVLFLNYAFEEDPPAGFPLGPDDELNRGCIQLYHHVASSMELRGKEILEVSCGHGGGASYLTRAFQPARYTALDLNPSGIAFCRQRHRIDKLSFVQGDALALPFGDASFDVVLNVEASHCYPSFGRFLSEVARVLRPGGCFSYADFRFSSGLAEWEAAIAASALVGEQTRTINAEVLRGMDRNSSRSEALIVSQLPKFLHGLGRDFAGVKDSRIYNALRDGAVSYRSYLFRKRSLQGGK